LEEEAMAEHMELNLDPNEYEIKMTWRTDDGPWSKPLRLSTALLRERSRGVRAALSNLNDYVRSNPDLIEERDTRWERYSAAIKELREQGSALYNALFVDGDLRSDAFSRALDNLVPGAELRVYCSEDEVTLPLGFVFEGGSQCSHETPSRAGVTQCAQAKPSRLDFAGFWFDRFNITMLIAGSGCEKKTLTVDPESFTTLYALHKKEFEDAWIYLGEDQTKLKKLVKIEVRDHYDWDSVKHACVRMDGTNSVVFVLAHSNGDWLELSGSKLDCQGFARMVQRGRNDDRAALLVLNCCLSVAGPEKRSLLSSVAKRGFCGLIGTEAEILNIHALRCGIRLMWALCADAQTLGQAFVAMQRAEDLFPLNLFYSCYADRNFKLSKPALDLAA
jgi:hypothetical protein